VRCRQSSWRPLRLLHFEREPDLGKVENRLAVRFDDESKRRRDRFGVNALHIGPAAGAAFEQPDQHQRANRFTEVGRETPKRSASSRSGGSF